jgi:dTDP-4-dehydrorhamnose reductase
VYGENIMTTFNTEHSSLNIIKVALIGSNGMLAADVKRFKPANVELIEYDLPDLDITDLDQVLGLCAEKFDIIINCAAYTNVDGCESNQEQAHAVNATGPGNLAQLAQRCGALLVHISTDFVFGGEKSTPYVEKDKPAPQSVYGQSKYAGEQNIIDSGLDAYFIVRTSWLYGAAGPNFVKTIARLAGEREELGIVADQQGTPTWSVDLAQAVWNLCTLQSEASQNIYGIYHFSNEGECSWYDFACEIITQLQNNGTDLKVKTIKPLRTEEYPVPAARPKYSVMSKQKYKAATATQVPEWKQSLQKYFEEQS